MYICTTVTGNEPSCFSEKNSSFLIFSSIDLFLRSSADTTGVGGVSSAGGTLEPLPEVFPPLSFFDGVCREQGYWVDVQCVVCL